jgi:hypothetical protein
MPPRSTGSHTVSDCLKDLGIVDKHVFDDCDTLEDEFRVVKKIYFAGTVPYCI